MGETVSTNSPFSALNAQERIRAVQERTGEGLIGKDAGIIWLEQPTRLWISMDSNVRAGALSQHQKQGILSALNRASGKSQVVMIMDSAGADVTDPLGGLVAVNTLLEALWNLRKSARIMTIVPRFAYGGAAILLCSAAHQVILGPEAELGVLGKRVLGVDGPSKLTLNDKTVRVSDDEVDAYLAFI